LAVEECRVEAGLPQKGDHKFNMFHCGTKYQRFFGLTTEGTAQMQKDGQFFGLTTLGKNQGEFFAEFGFNVETDCKIEKMFNYKIKEVDLT
jgi:hypothetical protein